VKHPKAICRHADKHVSVNVVVVVVHVLVDVVDFYSRETEQIYHG
jgi:hypothetical protein